MTDWLKILTAIAPRGKLAILRGMADAMPVLADEFEINSDMRIAHFLAQAAHESDGFRAVTEYASGAAYEGRRDLGNVKRGDGVRFKGRSPFQLTGRANYKAAGDALGVDLVAQPEAAALFPLAARIAAWYWDTRNLNTLADRDDLRGVTRKINGGFNGLDSRRAYLARAKRALAAKPGAAVGIADLPDADEPAPRSKIVAMQERLRALGYALGTIDGQVGTATVGALSAFQHDNDLPVTGALDAATETALWTTEETRPLPAARTEATAEDLREKSSTTIATADQMGALSRAGGAVIAVKGAVDGFQPAVDAATGVKGLAETASDLATWAASHWWMVLLSAIVIWLWFAKDRIVAARLRDHRDASNLGR